MMYEEIDAKVKMRLKTDRHGRTPNWRKIKNQQMEKSSYHIEIQVH